MAFLGSFDHALEMSPDVHASVERMLRQIQGAGSAVVMSDSLQTSNEHCPVLEGTACLIWLPDGHLSGES